MTSHASSSTCSCWCFIHACIDSAYLQARLMWFFFFAEEERHLQANNRNFNLQFEYAVSTQKMLFVAVVATDAICTCFMPTHHKDSSSVYRYKGTAWVSCIYNTAENKSRELIQWAFQKDLGKACFCILWWNRRTDVPENTSERWFTTESPMQLSPANGGQRRPNARKAHKWPYIFPEIFLRSTCL